MISNGKKTEAAPEAGPVVNKPERVGNAVDTGAHSGRRRIGRLAALPIEELVYHANHQRIEYGMHATHNTPKTPWFRWLENGFGPDEPENPLRHPEQVPVPGSLRRLTNREELAAELERDKVAARRSLRTASWGMMFYLITTDVIGPFNAPYAFSTVGFAGGIMLYITFGLAAYNSSFLLLNLYLRLGWTVKPRE